MYEGFCKERGFAKPAKFWEFLSPQRRRIPGRVESPPAKPYFFRGKNLCLHNAGRPVGGYRFGIGSEVCGIFAYADIITAAPAVNPKAKNEMRRKNLSRI